MRQLLVLLLLVVAAPAARAEVRLEVAGSTELSGDTLDVRVDVTNRGTTAAVPVAVEGELFGHRDQAKLEQGIEPGASRSVLLRYPLGEQQPGLHPLLLLLDYGPPGTSQSASQRAFLLLALGSAATGAVQLQVPEVEIAFLGPVTVRLTSTDGAPHRVRLSLATPRHLRADPQPVDVEVPAQGEARARLRVFRGAAPRGAPQGVLVVASTLDEPVVRTTVATSIVRVRAEVSWMARLRVPLISIAVLLLLGSVWRELA